MSRYTGYNQSGFANSTVAVTRATSDSSTPINYDNIFGETVLYLPFDSDINDASSFNHTVTSENGAVLSDTILKYGAGSLFVDDDPERITVTDDGNFNFGTQDFTIEGWFRFTEKYGPARLIHGGNNSSSLAPFLFYLSNDAVMFYSSSDGSNWNISNNKRIADNLSTGVWYHLAVTREGDTFRTFQDGTLKTTFTSSSALMDVEDGAIAIGGRPTDLQSLSGYIDDLRIIRGHAEYTASFTAPTSAVGLYSGNPVSLYLPFDSDVNDDSSYGHTVTASGDAAISSTQAKFGGNSAYFDGSGDYLTIPGHERFKFGTGDFTIEFFMRADTIDTSAQYSSVAGLIGFDQDAGATGAYFGIRQKNDTLVYVSGNAVNFTTASVLSADTWHHIAVCRTGGTTTMYCDGVSVGSFTDNTEYNDSASRHLYIGENEIGSTGNRFHKGYLDDIRILKGVARYTKNFVPPSQAVGAKLNGTNETNTTTDFTSVYLPFDSDVNDDGPNSLSVTAAGGAGISSAQSKFGGYSALFDGTDDALVVANGGGDFDFGTGDFTIELFFYQTSNSSRNDITGTYSGASTGWGISTNASNTNEIALFFGNSTILSSGASAYNLNTWHHLAIARSGSSIKMFIDGSAVASATNTTNITSGYNLRVGAMSSAVDASFLFFSGYIDDYRVLKGYAKYVADFVPPTSAVGTSVSETVNDLTMLYMPFDATTTSTTVASSQVEIYVPFESDFGDDGPNSLTLTEGGGGASSGRDVLIDTAPGSVPFGTNAAHFDNSSYSWNAANSGNLSTSRDVDFGTNDFTIEFWAYILSSQTNHAVLISTWTGGGWVIQIDSNSSLKFYDSSSNHATSSLPRNQWAHFAVVRASGVITWYVNGSAETTRTNSGNINGIGNLTFGSYPGGVGGYNGWLKDVRIINGTAVYTSDFSVPTAAHGGNGAPTVTTAQGGFVDLARNHGVRTAGTAAVNTSIKKFGTSSLFVDGNSDYAAIPDDSFSFSTGDFTVEAWVYHTGVSGSSNIFDFRKSSDGFTINMDTSGNVGYYSNKAGDYVISQGSNSIGTNSWKHLALCRHEGVTRLFIDGVLKASASDNYDYGSLGLTIGARYDQIQQWWAGYIDDLRVIQGHAKYTAAFTAPTSAHGHVSLETDGSTTETYSDTKFLSGIWDITDVRDKMMQSTWISNDSRLPNGAGLQVQGGTHRWSAAPTVATVTIKAYGAGGGGGKHQGPKPSPLVGGDGGVNQATFTIPAGTELNVIVGQGGRGYQPGAGGTFGGGSGGANNPGQGGGGGGGYSGVFEGPATQGNALIIAGGGGGSSGNSPGQQGGDGGMNPFTSPSLPVGYSGNPGEQGSPNPGKTGGGGTVSSGGPSNSGQGSALQGGNSGPGGGYNSSGGGGGGYYGGGAGTGYGGGGDQGSGGGGSAYTNTSAYSAAQEPKPNILSSLTQKSGGAGSFGSSNASNGADGSVEIIDGSGPTVYSYTGSAQTHTVA